MFSSFYEDYQKINVLEYRMVFLFKRIEKVAWFVCMLYIEFYSLKKCDNDMFYLSTKEYFLIAVLWFFTNPILAQNTIVRMAAESFLDSNELIEKTSEYEKKKFGEVNYDEPGAFFERSLEKYEEEFYLEAIEDLNQALLLVKDCKECYEFKGVCAYNKGLNYEGINSLNLAKQAYKTAFDYDSLMIDAYNGLGEIYVKEEKLDSARFYLQEAIRYSPDIAAFHHNLGVAELLDEKDGRAMKKFERALELDSCFALSNVTIAIVHILRDHLQKATKNLEKAIACDYQVAKLYYWKAMLWALKDRYKDSLIEINKAIKKEPENSLYLSTRGDFFIELKAYRNAIADFTKAFELNPVRNDNYRGNYYKEIYDFDFQYIVNCFDEQKEELDYQTISLIEEGICQIIVKKTELANGAFRKVLKKNRNPSPFLLYLAGLSFENIGHSTKAKDYYNRALEKNKEMYDVYKKRGLLLQSDKEYDRAFKDFEEMIRIQPDSYSGYLFKGNLLLQERKYSEAINNYDKVLQIDSSQINALFNRAQAFQFWEQYGEAVKDYARLVKKKPNDIIAYQNKGICHLALEQYDETLAACDSMIRIFEKNHVAYNMKGIVYMNKRKFEEAIGNFGKATDFEHSFDEAWFNRGLIYYQIKDWRNALSDLNQAIFYKNNNPAYFYVRAAIKKKLKNTSACTDLQKAMQLGMKLIEEEQERICGSLTKTAK